MYSSVGQQDGTVEQLSGQTMWTNDFDKEYGNCIDPSILQELEDLPRATSAPPHLQNRHGAASADILNRSSTTARVQGGENYNEMRYEDDYDAFYSFRGEPDKLPPPSEGHALYSDLQGYLPQYKDPSSFMTGAFPRFGSGGGVFGMPSGGGSGAFSSQTSLNRAALETVEEQPSGKKEDSILQTLNQLHIGNEIQRPGSQPAPNLLQALAAEAGHYRSASALASFNLEGFSGIPGNGGPPPDSNPAPNESSGFNPMLQQSQSNDYLTQMQGPGSMLAGSLEYQAAYQAALQTALLQSQNNPQMMLGPQMSPNAQTNHHHGGLQTHANYNGGIQGHGMPNEMSILAAKMHQQQSPVHGGYPQTNSSNPAPTSGGFQGTKDLTYPKEDRGGRGKRYGRRDRERVADPAFSNDSSYYDNQYLKFNAIEEVVGQVIQVAQDQNGCRFLQRKFDEGGSQAISKVFSEIVSSIIQLMKDPFGNYLIQKLLDRCSEDQRTEVVKAVAEGGEIISIALSTHGTRAVQKLIETLTTEEQRKFAISALKPGVVDLIKDLNGNHVVQRCLQRLGPEDSQFIYDAAIGCCVEVASHRHGCCVLQRCIDFATPEQRHDLVMEISNNALVLSQDAFGNYVVQYVLDLGHPEASQSVMNVLTGHYSELAIQKFSSNVVEKCLKLGGLDDARESIIKEIMHSPALARLLQDPYGNYVVQSALSVTSGSLHQSLVECIRPYLPTLKGNPHGKRILQKVLASLKDPF